MLKKITLTIFMIAFALIAQANAQTEIAPEKQTAVKELVSLINADNQAETMVGLLTAQMDSMREPIIDAVLKERTDLSAAERQTVRELLLADQNNAEKRFQEKLMQKINFTEMINEISMIVYDKYYTLDEIKELTAFYKTPTGQKTLKNMTPLMTDTLKLTQERVISKIPVVLKELEDEEKQEIERQVNAKKPRPKKSVSK
jgi:hypothetical protein